MNNLTNQNEYKNFIVDVATNSGLLHFYFEAGGMVC